MPDSKHADIAATDSDTGPAPGSALLVVRVWLADRPGALGQVASRIGSIRGDIVGVDVLERTEAVAIDEFSVTLPSAEHIPLLMKEIEEVDGASVEEWRVVEAFPDPRLDALISADRLCCAESTEEVFALLVKDAVTEFNLDWAATLCNTTITASWGRAPDAGELAALAIGTTASPLVAAGHCGPDDLAVARLPTTETTMLVGRSGHPFRRRERKQIAALAQVADRVAKKLGT